MQELPVGLEQIEIADINFLCNALKNKHEKEYIRTVRTPKDLLIDVAERLGYEALEIVLDVRGGINRIELQKFGEFMVVPTVKTPRDDGRLSFDIRLTDQVFSIRRLFSKHFIINGVNCSLSLIYDNGGNFFFLKQKSSERLAREQIQRAAVA